MKRDEIWNVFFDEDIRGVTVTKSYLGIPVSHPEALIWAELFRAQYFGKPYPNGRGFYPFYNIRVGLHNGS